MTLIFIDSFDHYTTNAQLVTKWSSAGSRLLSSTGAGRNGTSALTTDGSNLSNEVVTKTIESSETIIVGLAIYVTNQFINNENYIEFRDSSTAQVGIYLTSAGAISVKRGGAGGTTLGTSSNTLSLNTWQYIEFKATINDSGSYEVKVDGTSWLSGTDDTQNTSNNYADVIAVSLQRLAWTKIDDLYVCNGDGTTNNNFLGDVRITALFPDGVGTYSQFSPTSGDNYTCVDETTPNDDTDYISTSGAGNIDTYTFQDLPVASGTILGIQFCPRARKDDAGTRAISSVVYINSTVYSGTKNSLTTSYDYILDIFETNPDTEYRWIVDEINEAEFGVKLEE